MRKYSSEEKKLITQVLPGVAQELRITMTNMYIAAGRLAPVEKRESDPKTDWAASVFTQSYFRMTRLLDNLTDASDLADESLLMDRLNEDIVGVVRGICEKAEALFADEGVTLVFESERPSLIIAMNGERVERMVFNLLSNALKFTPKGGTVTVRIRSTRQSVLLSVSDTGCGIEPERLERIFDSFLDRDTLRPPPRGMGLGLAICRRVAEGHGGSIVAESRKGKGACFTVSLPNRRTETLVLRQPAMEYGGGFNRTLVELADAVGIDAFSCRRMD